MQHSHNGFWTATESTRDLALTALLLLSFVPQLCYGRLSAQFIDSAAARKTHAGA